MDLLDQIEKAMDKNRPAGMPKPKKPKVTSGSSNPSSLAVTTAAPSSSSSMPRAHQIPGSSGAIGRPGSFPSTSSPHSSSPYGNRSSPPSAPGSVDYRRASGGRTQGYIPNQGGDRDFKLLQVAMNLLKFTCVETEFVKRFDVTIEKINGEKVKDMTRSYRHDQAFIEKERFLFGLMRTMISLYPELFGEDRYTHVYDGGTTIYSISCRIDELPVHAAQMTFSKEDVRDKFPKHVDEYLGKFTTLKITFKYTGKVYIQGRHFKEEGNYKEAIKFYEVLCDAELHDGNYLNFTSKSFSRKGFDKDIGYAKEVKTGLDKNVRLVGDNLETAVPALQSSSKASAFHKAIPMLDYLSEAMKVPAEQIPRFLMTQKNDLEEANRILYNSWARCSHISRTFTMKEISSEKTPNSTRFVNKDEEKVTVNEYYRAQYNIILRYPDGPMVVERKPAGWSFYPIELLNVVEGQRVGVAALKDAEKLHNMARKLPHEKRVDTERQLDAMRLRHADNAYFKAFKISLEDTFVTTMAKQLQPPTRIGFGNEVLKGTNYSGKKFYEPAVLNTSVVLILFDGCLSEEAGRAFYKKLWSAASEKGMKLPVNVEVATRYTEVDQSDLFRLAKQKKVGILLFICKGSKTSSPADIHGRMKYLETKYELVTENVLSTTATSCMSSQGTQTLMNIVRKLNGKLGGINERIDLVLPTLTARQHPRDAADWLHKHLMLIGIEMSHPGPQCAYDRVTKAEVSSPTVIGMAFSTDNHARLNGLSWYQRPRVYSIIGIKEKIAKALRTRFEHVKVMPEIIVIYRGGGSEGEFKEIIKEIEEIRQGVQEFGGAGYAPKLLFIVAASQTNNMIIPAKMPNYADDRRKPRPRDFNVPPGTVVDSGLTDPNFDEFLLVSQEANIGTSKPTRYVIHSNDTGIPKMDIVKMTNSLASLHLPTQKSTSKTNVLFAAHELAKRGQANWRQLMDEQRKEVTDTVSFNKSADEDDDAYFARKSQEVQNECKVAYWT